MTYPIQAHIYDALRERANQLGGVGSYRLTSPLDDEPLCIHGIALSLGLETIANVYPDGESPAYADRYPPSWLGPKKPSIGLPAFYNADAVVAAWQDRNHIEYRYTRMPFDLFAECFGLVRVEPSTLSQVPL